MMGELDGEEPICVMMGELDGIEARYDGRAPRCWGAL
jgi:hypothetical protein